MSTGSIDAVFTWVDGNDPLHVAKRQAFTSEATPGHAHYRANEATRFRDAGELWYSVRLARKNAPWLRTIYIVTDAQSPDWLTDAAKAEFGIVLVDHRHIFRGYEAYLPTFNSQSIEAMIHRIEGLGERFIYLNDDVFLLEPISVDYFFCDGVSVFRGEWDYTTRFQKRIARMLGLRRKTPKGLNGFKPEWQEWRGRQFFRLAHTPYPLKRSNCARLLEEQEDPASLIGHRFRGAEQPWPIGLYANRALRRGEAVARRGEWAYLPDPGKLDRPLDQVLEGIEHDGGKTLCIQSLDQYSSADQERIRAFLQRKLDQ